MSQTQKELLYSGACHCKAVEFQVYAPIDLVVWKCNCSICLMKQNHHFIVPKEKFKLVKGHDQLILYTFNTHIAKHYFCKICGVQSFYSPRSNPDGFAITFNCLTNKKSSFKIQEFNGDEWEETIKIADISKFSKL